MLCTILHKKKAATVQIKKSRLHFSAPFSVIQSFPKEILLTIHFLHFGLKHRSLSLALTFDYITAIWAGTREGMGKERPFMPWQNELKALSAHRELKQQETSISFNTVKARLEFYKASTKFMADFFWPGTNLLDKNTAKLDKREKSWSLWRNQSGQFHWLRGPKSSTTKSLESSNLRLASSVTHVYYTL